MIVPVFEANKEEADFETAIHYARYGKFQKFLLGVCGLIYATCAISTTTLSFVLPSAECDFHLSSNDKGKLSAMPLIGMIFGCCVWGFVADSKGRRTAIMSSLLVDFLAGFISAFSQTFPVFLMCRFFSGFGIIGATSIVFSYLGEFLPNKKRDTVLGRLELFWNVGIIILPGIAWTLLNKTTFDTFSMLNFYNPWRIFVLICCLPSLLSCVCLYFLPETPKYLISKRRYQNAIMVFQRVYRINTNKPLSSFPVTSLSGEGNNNEKSMEYDSNSNYFERLRENIVSGFEDLKELSTQPYLKYLGITAISDFGLMASYYTLIMWFPEIFERFNNFENSHGGQKAGICEVSQIGAYNETLSYSERVCEPAVNNRVFIETIIIGLSCIPSSISLSFFMAKLGKKYVLVTSLFLAGLSTMALNWVSSSEETLVLSAIFEALTSILETVLFCVVVELFPTNLRAPALAITATAGRIGAIFGNLVFGALIDIQCSVPIYLFGALLVGSGILTLGIPQSETYFVLH
ncbi:synaptic vesicle glycoprotein 2C-like isoform X2 [Coccinella septempunctata]|uniref:synaptic vesicle glycoprotein 2C-like isoform X2 n=1 Tax=Coccinella septempunctata TaxID=41139 RepID=UPI001D08F598|nr:synaptic vesicle glycoprotein 2C-like isoform X2 [Coccinella septempunctata]